MPAVTIKGIRLNSLHIDLDTATGDHKLSSAEYALISSQDKVLAKQSIGGYGGMTIEMSPATRVALGVFVNSYNADVTSSLGLD